MGSLQCVKRLNKEYQYIQLNQTPYILAKPNESNILEWHYLLTGPPDTPFSEGQYHGILKFPSEYPFKPPSIIMITPNAKFLCNTRLCLSMSDYHPDLWNPAWSVSTILTGLLSFMTSDENTTGSIITSTILKEKLARESIMWNNTHNPKFIQHFPEIYDQNKKLLASRLLKERNENRVIETKKPLSISHENILCILEKLDPLDSEDKMRILDDYEKKFFVTNDYYRKKIKTFFLFIILPSLTSYFFIKMYHSAFKLF